MSRYEHNAFLNNFFGAAEAGCLKEFNYAFELLNPGARTSLSSAEKQEIRGRPDKFKGLERDVSAIKLKENEAYSR